MRAWIDYQYSDQNRDTSHNDTESLQCIDNLNLIQYVLTYLSKSFCLVTSNTHANKYIGNYRVSSDISGYTLRYFSDIHYHLK